MKRQRPSIDQKAAPSSKKRLESTTTNTAVTNFFKPASQKEPSKLQWRVINDSLLVGRYGKEAENGAQPAPRRRIAAFDFDSTLIKTSSGNVFGKTPTDWQWWDSGVPGKLKKLYSDDYRIAIISNQGGISLKTDTKTVKSEPKRLSDFKLKVSYVLEQLDFPISIYAATGKDVYRKPRPGMWTELLHDYGLEGKDLELQDSIFVGDAGGRLARDKIKADHSSSDRDFAANVGINYKTPEEYFLGEPAQPFARTIDPLLYMDEAQHNSELDGLKNAFERRSDLEIVLLCGSPGAGKSTFYWNCLEPLGYERVNQDILKTRDKCLKAAAEYILEGRPVVVDNTNADVETRSKWIELAGKKRVPIRCVCFTTPASVCKHNDAVRALNDMLFNPERRSMLPGIAFSGFATRYREPTIKEGFQDITTVPFKFQGNEEQKKTWMKYWI